MSKRRKILIEGNHAVSWGVALSRAQVIPVYPITPQTHISETLAEFVAEGRLDARYIKVESEHSAMAACIGAATAGARAFTATSAQGLALMHELLHWASGARLPIVMANVNRALAAPWNIWNDQSDSMAQRDTGWLQFYVEDNQEALDSIIMAFIVSEKALVPSMVILDAFILSHTREIVEIPTQEEVDAFLPKLKNPHAIDLDAPRTYSPVFSPDFFTEAKYKQYRATKDALSTIEEVNSLFSRAFGRSYPSLFPYRTENAEAILMCAGALSGTIRAAVDELRDAGNRVGMIKVRTFRPFPDAMLKDMVRSIAKIGVIDKCVTPGLGGPLAQEVRAALYDGVASPTVTSFIGGLGGRDITKEIIVGAFEALRNGDAGREPIFLGLKK